MDILLKKGADINTRVTDTTSLTARIARTSTMTNREGQTALFYAAQLGRKTVVRFLLDRGAKVDDAILNAVKNNAEITAMLRAAK